MMVSDVCKEGLLTGGLHCTLISQETRVLFLAFQWSMLADNFMREESFKFPPEEQTCWLPVLWEPNRRIEEGLENSLSSTQTFTSVLWF